MRNDRAWIALLAVVGLCCIGPLVVAILVAVGPGVLVARTAGPAAGIVVALSVFVAIRVLRGARARGVSALRDGAETPEMPHGR